MTAHTETAHGLRCIIIILVPHTMLGYTRSYHDEANDTISTEAASWCGREPAT